MSRPLVVSIPHRLGKDEALRRLKNGLGSASANFGHVFKVEEQIWTGPHLQYRISALVATMTLWRRGAEPMKRRSKARPLSRGARRDPVPQLCKLVCGGMLRPCTPQASKLSTGYPQSAEVYLKVLIQR